MNDGSERISNTRGVSLVNIAGLCYVLGAQQNDLSVKALANEAISQGVLDFEPIPTGKRLPTRIHHHMIALRKLDLVRYAKHGGRVYYHLAPNGQLLYDSVLEKYKGVPQKMDHYLRRIWRPILVQSEYVRHQWLRYFMNHADFTYDSFIALSTPIKFYRLPSEQRLDPARDSGYRLVSEHWAERALDTLDYRELYQGLHRWTNDVYLTDDRIPEGLDIPYLYQSQSDATYEMDAFAVKSWLDPELDMEQFEHQVGRYFDELRANRASIPRLILYLCGTHQYSKFNVREMLITLYYVRRDKYFYERGSEFLIDQAFEFGRPEEYYVQIEGVWRTGLVRG